jgi:UDP-N-acetylmuramate dehydrogenase
MGIESLIRERVRLAPYTTLGIGGPARFFVDAFTEDEVLDAVDWAADRSIPVFVLGGGSNVLVSDEGFPGLVVRVALRGITSRARGSTMLVTAGAGEDWDQFVAWGVERHLAGVECLSGIPGFVGGTPVQNVGAYGQEVSETIHGVRAYDRHQRKVVELSNRDCRFSYRASIFNTTDRDRYIVLAVTFALTMHGHPALKYADVKNHFAGRGGTPSLHEVREAVRAIRAKKGMLIVPHDPDCRSAGSFFKNPLVTAEKFTELEQVARKEKLIGKDESIPHFDAPEGKVKVPAAWLIERAGFQKGWSRGRAGISSKHTLALVNRGGATAGDLLRLMREIQEKVQEKFGIRLTPEPVFVSTDGW